MTDNPDPEFWYRYEDQRWSVTIDAEMEIFGTRYDLNMRKYKVVRDTPKGAWLKEVFGPLGKMESSEPEFWVGLGTGKRRAYPTRELALQGYIARKKRQITLLQHQLSGAETFLKLARQALEKEVLKDD